jgi:hypothetical protein
MTSGGHANSGPAPSADAIRRDRPSDQQTWTTLPDKREGPLPPWPLTESTKREDALWARLWQTGQATQWEGMGIEREVALHVRTFCEAEQLDAKVDLRKLALAQMETLGLSTTGLARRRWRFASQGTVTPEATRPNDRRRTTSKDREADIISIQSRRAG